MNSKTLLSKSKPTPENPITLYVSLTQRDGRIARVGTLAMTVGGMSSKCQSSGRLTNSHPRYLDHGNHSHQPNRGNFTPLVSLTAGGVRLATGQQSTLTVCRQTVEVVREAPEKPASRICAAVGFRQQRNVPQADFWTVFEAADSPIGCRSGLLAA
jgi:hypothetical protein